MNAIEIKKQIVSKLDTIEDSSILETVLKYVKNIKGKSVNLSGSQLNELDKRRENYLSGNAKLTNLRTIKNNLKQNHGL